MLRISKIMLICLTGAMLCFSSIVKVKAETTAEVKAENVNLLENGSFETVEALDIYPAKKQAFPGWVINRSLQCNAEFGISDEDCQEGKHSFKITKNDSDWMFLTCTARKVADFTGSYNVSIYIKTKASEIKPQGEVILSINSWTEKAGNSNSLRVAKVQGTTDWTRYTATISQKNIAFAPDAATWGIVVDAALFKGEIWIDNVKLSCSDEK